MLSKEKAAVGSFDGFASANQTNLAVCMRRKDCAVGRETESVSVLVYEYLH